MNLLVEILQTIEEFEKLESDWNSLLESCEEQSFFLTWHWLFTWWAHFSAQGKLYIVVLKSQDQEIFGIAPLYIKKKSNPFSQNVLTFLGSTPISSDFLDIICAPEHKNYVAKSLASHFTKNTKQWSAIQLCDTLEKSVCSTSLRGELLEKGFKHTHLSSQICPYMSIPPSLEELQSTLSSRLRNTIKRKLKKAEKAGITFSSETQPTEIEQQMLSLFDLHQKRWQSNDHSGSFSKEGIRSFHLDIAKYNLPKNSLVLFTLKQAGKTIAILYSFKHNNKIYYYQSGFDPDYSEYSPGTILMWKAIEHSMENGLEHFDFLRGDEGYKSLWTNTQSTTSNTIYYRSSNIGLATSLLILNIKNKIKRSLKKLVKTR